MNSTVKMYGINYHARLRGDTVHVWSVDKQAFSRDVPKEDWVMWRKAFLAENPWAIITAVR